MAKSVTERVEHGIAEAERQKASLNIVHSTLFTKRAAQLHRPAGPWRFDSFRRPVGHRGGLRRYGRSLQALGSPEPHGPNVPPLTGFKY